MLEWLLDLVFPPKCLVCDRRGSALCPGCQRSLPYLPPGLCARCASQQSVRDVCLGCRRLSPALSWVRAPLIYSGPARRAVLMLKFRSGRYLAPLMGELIRSAVPSLEVDLVVPVPLSPSRLRDRGFNQATLLAEQVADSVHGRLTPNVLTRRNRPAQSTLSATARLANMAGVFACAAPGEVRGKRVLLVDDVVTTGATVSACADTLAEAGAARVFALAFARDL